MAIHNPKAPQGGPEVIAELDSERTRREVQVAQPHRVYVVREDALKNGEWLAAAEPSTWRYLLIEKDAGFAAVELIERNGALTFAAMEEGPFVQSTIDVLVRAERLDDVRRGDFELRLLKIPSRYLVALWLHSDARDLLLPLPPAPSGVEAARACTPDELINRLTGR